MATLLQQTKIVNLRTNWNQPSPWDERLSLMKCSLKANLSHRVYLSVSCGLVHIPHFLFLVILLLFFYCFFSLSLLLLLQVANNSPHQCQFTVPSHVKLIEMVTNSKIQPRKKKWLQMQQKMVGNSIWNDWYCRCFFRQLLFIVRYWTIH